MISLEDIALRRGPRLLFERVTMKLHGNERVGIVGDNGSGKSSLFALLLGEIHADQGSVALPTQSLVAHVAQHTPSSDQSAIDFVLDGDEALRALQSKTAMAEESGDGDALAECYAEMERIDGYAAPSRAARLLDGLGFNPTQMEAPTKSFSGGWRVRLNLAKALMSPSDILLLDEPTNHLDLDAVVWLEDWLSSYQGTLLLISHDRDFLDGICNRILHIEHNQIRSYNGNYSRFERTRAEAMAAEQAAYHKQQRAISHMEDFVRRFKAKATKAKQAQSRVKALERMQTIAPAHIYSPFRFSFLEPQPASDPLLRLDEVHVGYQSGSILSNLSFSIGNKDRIALVGPNGAGKSTLVKLLAGELEPGNGEIIQAKNLNVGYFAQHQLEQLDPEATPLTQFTRIYPRTTPQDIRNFLGGFGFNGERVNEKIAPFSGGEKARLALALLIFSKPNLLLMDEPTNHLDIEMRHALTVAFQQYDGAILLVSHDRHLIRTVTDRLWLVYRGGVSVFEEDIDGYMRWAKKVAQESRNASGTKRRESNNFSEKSTSLVNADNLSKKEKRQQSALLRQQIKPLTQSIRQCEKNMTLWQKKADELEKTLSDPKIYESASTADLAELMRKKSGADKEVAKLESEWLSLSEELEQVNQSLSSNTS
ncbi:MAG: ATP-binding cassette domain-containing protein [Acidiferrobacterales bacterium]|nr:ATP-binding cassette domain-containing protein [Acidiferrobacterales bacterium]